MATSSLSLNTGAKMPFVSLGTWKIEKSATKDAVLDAMRLGYRGFDLACDYGNEKEVGEGIAAGIAEGICKREDLFLTSKLWNTFHAKEHVELGCRKTLSDLGIDYLDLYLIHFPIPLRFVPIEEVYPPEWIFPASGVMEKANVPYRETWEAMQELQSKGLTKAIGVCNLNCGTMADLLTYAKITPAVNQVEIHPYLRQERLVQYCQKHGIVVTGFSPLGSIGYQQMGMDKGHGKGAIEEPSIKAIAKAVGKSAAQVCLRWQVQRQCTIVPKSSNAERLKENLSVFDFELSAEQMAEIDKLDRNLRYNDPGNFARGFGPEWEVTGYPIYD